MLQTYQKLLGCLISSDCNQNKEANKSIGNIRSMISKNHNQSHTQYSLLDAINDFIQYYQFQV